MISFSRILCKVKVNLCLFTIFRVPVNLLLTLVSFTVFVYDRNQMNVLEVNKTDYESCNSDHPLHNWTTGAGRDVVPLNVTRNYYFVSGKGFCFGGMKIAVHVENLPPPPKAAPIKSWAPTLSSKGHNILLMPLVFAIGAAWDSFIHLW